MLLKKHYITLLLSALLVGSAAAKEFNKPGVYTSVNSAAVSNVVIISGENITLINNNILNVLKNGSTANVKATGQVKVQAGKKIVLKPGTKITAKKGESFHAVVTAEEQENKPVETTSFNYRFFKQIDNNKAEHEGYSKGADSGSIILGGTNAVAVVVDNQHRKVANVINFNGHDLFKATITRNNNNITKGSGFNPETIKVLRL